MNPKLLAIALKATQSVRYGGSVAWKYLKVEAAPPMTVDLLKGPFGKKLEATAANAIDSVINGIQGMQNDLRLEKEQAIRKERAAFLAELAKEKKKQEAKEATAVTAAKKAKAEREKKESESKAAKAKKKDGTNKKKPAKRRK